jgi:hypothetical protein
VSVEEAHAALVADEDRNLPHRKTLTLLISLQAIIHRPRPTPQIREMAEPERELVGDGLRGMARLQQE